MAHLLLSISPTSKDSLHSYHCWHLVSHFSSFLLDLLYLQSPLLLYFEDQVKSSLSHAWDTSSSEHASSTLLNADSCSSLSDLLLSSIKLLFNFLQVDKLKFLVVQVWVQSILIWQSFELCQLLPLFCYLKLFLSMDLVSPGLGHRSNLFDKVISKCFDHPVTCELRVDASPQQVSLS